ncbi:hypothetical protein P171DRAFT_409895 [Karstenula rhodostoma CBS 690.94]|uniref:Uncharacterized protein n=1 Tax=Karstenula rhodostoma CBS 690.94 TaxID=1392251 RepID=A0A9P4UEC9_9PLEO|nr:hypothetical protein P171DRAFT_409895 [Karstenula rhodostoma CBS 690.94]
MHKRHSSSSSRPRSPRPGTYRKRSNSFPISEALGCSTPEAELILAEGRAAVRSRLAGRQRGRSRRSDNNAPFNPKDHVAYLAQRSALSETADRHSLSPPGPNPPRHVRIPSDATDRSTSTIVAPNQQAVQEAPNDTTQAAGPLGDYSAQLAKFIQSQLNSIPAYTSGDSSISPRSCPDLTFARSVSPAKSPTRMAMKRPINAPSLIRIPSIRAPARSAFSEWSSTDEETDDEAAPLPDTYVAQLASKAESYTPSLLRYYEQPNDSTFLFTTTPLANDEHAPHTGKAFSFPPIPSPSQTQAERSSTRDEDYPSSDSKLSLLSSSSAPSLSSISPGSYFENKMPLSQVSGFKNRLLAAVTPPPGKVIPAISPFEEDGLADVHDILVQSQRSVLVDGMSFDMVRDFAAPNEGMRRYQTQC